MRFGLFIKIVAQRRGVVQQRLDVRVFRIQHAQRVGVHAAFAVFVQLIFKLLKIGHQRVAIVSASLQRTDRVQLQRNVAGDAQLAPPAGGQHNQLGIDIRPLQAKRFGANLVELTVAPFLRTFVAEHRPNVPQALFLIVQETMFDTGAYAASRAFRT